MERVSFNLLLYYKLLVGIYIPYVQIFRKLIFMIFLYYFKFAARNKWMKPPELWIALFTFLYNVIKPTLQNFFYFALLIYISGFNSAFSHLFFIVIQSKTYFFEFSCLKKLSLCHKLKCSNSYIFATWWCKPLIFQT